jgi:hypothetical protein
VCGVHGYVLLPDDFTLPDGLSWSYQTNNWDTNTYDAQTWITMEATGAVFLPAAGYRYGSSVYDVGSAGDYWSASCDLQNYAGGMRFDSDGADLGIDYRYLGFSVRLVQDL